MLFTDNLVYTSIPAQFHRKLEEAKLITATDTFVDVGEATRALAETIASRKNFLWQVPRDTTEAYVQQSWNNAALILKKKSFNFALTSQLVDGSAMASIGTRKPDLVCYCKVSGCGQYCHCLLHVCF